MRCMMQKNSPPKQNEFHGIYCETSARDNRISICLFMFTYSTKIFAFIYPCLVFIQAMPWINKCVTQYSSLLPLFDDEKKNNTMKCVPNRVS